MVSTKALLVCLLVLGLCFVVISSEVEARELADKTLDKTKSVEHTTPTKEEKTEANGVKPDYYGGGYGGYGGYWRGGYGGYGGYGRGGYGGYGGYGHGGYGGYGGYGRGGYGGYGGYGRGGYGGYYPPERKTQESTSTENPDYYYPGGGYGPGYWPRPRPYPYWPRPWYGRGGYGGRYPPGGED